MVGGELCVCVCRSGGGGWLGWSLIPEENVEEINLNYKDEASLESGSGRSTEGREGGETVITPLLLCTLVTIFCLFFFHLSCGNEVACHPSSLACHPDTPPSFTHAQASYQLVSSVAAAGVDGTCRDHSIPTLLPVLSSHRQQMSWFLREHTSRCWPLVACETTEKKSFSKPATSRNSQL